MGSQLENLVRFRLLPDVAKKQAKISTCLSLHRQARAQLLTHTQVSKLRADEPELIP